MALRDNAVVRELKLHAEWPSRRLPAQTVPGTELILALLPQERSIAKDRNAVENPSSGLSRSRWACCRAGRPATRPWPIGRPAPQILL